MLLQIQVCLVFKAYLLWLSWVFINYGNLSSVYGNLSSVYGNLSSVYGNCISKQHLENTISKLFVLWLFQTICEDATCSTQSKVGSGLKAFILAFGTAGVGISCVSTVSMYNAHEHDQKCKIYWNANDKWKMWT